MDKSKLDTLDKLLADADAIASDLVKEAASPAAPGLRASVAQAQRMLAAHRLHLAPPGGASVPPSRGNQLGTL